MSPPTIPAIVLPMVPRLNCFASKPPMLHQNPDYYTPLSQ
jgi:hypothetical protein